MTNFSSASIDKARFLRPEHERKCIWTVRASNRLHEFPIIRCALLGKFVLPYSSTVASGNGNWISCKNRYRVAFDQRTLVI